MGIISQDKVVERVLAIYKEPLLGSALIRIFLLVVLLESTMSFSNKTVVLGPKCIG